MLRVKHVKCDEVNWVGYHHMGSLTAIFSLIVGVPGTHEVWGNDMTDGVGNIQQKPFPALALDWFATLHSRLVAVTLHENCPEQYEPLEWTATDTGL